MKKILEFKILIMFVILVLGVTYFNSLAMKRFIAEEQLNEIVMDI